jgi:hypothetical protein
MKRQLSTHPISFYYSLFYNERATRQKNPRKRRGEPRLRGRAAIEGGGWLLLISEREECLLKPLYEKKSKADLF